MENKKALVVLKNWASTIDKERNLVIDYRMAYGKVTDSSEKTLVLGEKLFISADSILTVEMVDSEPPKNMVIGNWDMKEWKEIEAKTPIYIVE